MNEKYFLQDLFEQGVVLFQRHVLQVLVKIVFDETWRGYHECLHRINVFLTVVLQVEFGLNVLLNQREKLAHFIFSLDFTLLALLFGDVLFDFRLQDSLALGDHEHLRQALLHH